MKRLKPKFFDRFKQQNRHQPSPATSLPSVSDGLSSGTQNLLVDAENQTDILRMKTESTETSRVENKSSATLTDPVVQQNISSSSSSKFKYSEDDVKRREDAIRIICQSEKRSDEQMIQELHNENKEYKDKIHELLNREKEHLKVERQRDSLLLRNAELSNCIEKLKKELQDEMIERQETQKSFLELKESIEKREKEESDDPMIKKKHHEEIVLKLEETIAEKNKTIKLQQQRIIDIKKSIQRGDLPSVNNLFNKSGYCSDDSGSTGRRSPPSSMRHDHSSSASLNQHQSDPVNDGNVNRSKSPPATLDVSNNHNMNHSSDGHSSYDPSTNNPLEVNFEYLKNVIFKYITSSDYESQKQLIKAITVLLHFDSKQEQSIRETLEWRNSWLSSLPLVGPNLKPLVNATGSAAAASPSINTTHHHHNHAVHHNNSTSTHQNKPSSKRSSVHR